MSIGAALLLIAIGAILRFAVTAHVSGVDLRVVGTILMVVGVIGLVISLIWLAAGRRRHTVVAQETYSQAPLGSQPPLSAPPAGPYRTRVEERRYDEPPR